MKKNYLTILVIVCLAMGVLAGCGGSGGSTMESDSNNSQSSNEDQTTGGDEKKSDEDQKADNPKGKSADELSAAEKTALNFYKAYEVKDSEKRKKAVNKYVTDKGNGSIKKLFLLGASSPLKNPKTDIKVMETANGTGDNGKTYSLVLLHMTGQDGSLYEKIVAVMDEKVFFVYSPTAEGKFKEKYQELRKKFDTPVPESIKQRKEKQANAKAEIEVVQQTYNAWKDSIGSVWVNYGAIIKNTGNSAADIKGVQVNFKGKDGSVVGTAQMITPTPDVVPAGGTAYITVTTQLKSLKDPKKFKKATLNVDFSKTTDKPKLLKTSKVKLTESSNDYGSPYIVTGTIKNPADKKLDNIRVAAALFDKNDKLVGVYSGSLQVSLNPSGTAGFELNYPQLPKSVKGKAKSVKVKAYSWGF